MMTFDDIQSTTI